MQLYITPLSPYAHMVRILVLEKGLADRVEVIEAKTRVADSPYYAINPSGRVPYLIRDDGVGIEDSAVICAYLDELDGATAFTARSTSGRRRSSSTSDSGAGAWPTSGRSRSSIR
jgi:glutathione S-transferase